MVKLESPSLSFPGKTSQLQRLIFLIPVRGLWKLLTEQAQNRQQNEVYMKLELRPYLYYFKLTQPGRGFLLSLNAWYCSSVFNSQHLKINTVAKCEMMFLKLAGIWLMPKEKAGGQDMRPKILNEDYPTQ